MLRHSVGARNARFPASPLLGCRAEVGRPHADRAAPIEDRDSLLPVALEDRDSPLPIALHERDKHSEQQAAGDLLGGNVERMHDSRRHQLGWPSPPGQPSAP